MLKTQGLTPVTQEQGQSVAKQMGATYVECSSKEMNGVHEVFEFAVDTAVGREIVLKEESEARRQYLNSNGDGVKSGRIGKAGTFKKKKGCGIF